MKVFGQLEKAQLENTTADVGALPKGMITYRTDLNIAKVSNGTSMLALIDESSTQTLSGKTYATPSFTGPFTMAQTTTPANPSSGSNKFYFKADGKLYTLDASGNEAAVGSGAGGGVVNLVTNGSADDTASSIFVPYADTGSRPVDGTGGSPTVTTSITSVSPLNGTKSYLLTKPAANVQGQGWAVPFTVDLAYRAKVLKISADYIINSGTFVPGSSGLSPTDGDLIWYIYDVTNSQLIEPSNIKMFSSDTGISDKFEATFQTSVSGSSYRLLAHVASTSALAFEIKLDNVTVSPQVYIFGTPITDWQLYVPTTTGLGTISSEGVYWRRVGDSLEIKGTIVTGTTTAVAASISLPPGMVVDPSKNPSTTNSASHGAAYNVSATTGYATAAQGPFPVFSDTAINAGLLYFARNNFGARFDKALGNALVGSSERLRFEVKGIPIVGAGSSVRISDSYDGRVITAKATRSVAFSVPDNVTTKIPFDVVAYDDVGGFSSGTYTVKSAGKHRISGHVNTNTSAATYEMAIYLYINGAAVEAVSNGKVGTASQPHGITYDFQRELKVGDTVEIWCFQNSGAALELRGNNVVFGLTSMAVEKIQGPQAVAASEKISFAMGHSSGQAVAAGVSTTMICNVREHDSHNIYNTANGNFSFPRPGFVNLFARFLSQNIAAGATQYYGQLTLIKNGANYKVFSGRYNVGAGTTTYAIGEGGVGFYSLPTDVWRIEAYYPVATAILADSGQSFITAEMD